MAQLLVTMEDEWYQAIASVRNYNEKAFEKKFYKYASDVFQNFYVIRFNQSITNRHDRSEKYKPDLALVTKDLKRWILIEVELCKKDLDHTKRQIRCFLNPEYDTGKLVTYLLKQHSAFKGRRAELTELVTDHPPELLVVYDDYCLDTFQNLRVEFPDLKICIWETYRTPKHESEAYRLSGDYPYEVSFASRLEAASELHYKILRPEVVKDFPEGEVEIFYRMRTIKADLMKDKSDDWYIHIPRNPLPPDIAVQLSLTSENQLLIQKL